jgi:hypothetical protein
MLARARDGGDREGADEAFGTPGDEPRATTHGQW